MKLYECVAEYRTQLDALAELDLDAQTYADTLESMGGELQDKLRAVIAYSLDLEIEATGAAAASKRMKERADSLDSRVKWLRDYALRSMEATGMNEVSTDEWAAKVAKKPASVVIAEGAEIPTAYQRTIPAKYEPDKAALKAAVIDTNASTPTYAVWKPADSASPSTMLGVVNWSLTYSTAGVPLAETKTTSLPSAAL